MSVSLCFPYIFLTFLCPNIVFRGEEKVWGSPLKRRRAEKSKIDREKKKIHRERGQARRRGSRWPCPALLTPSTGPLAAPFLATNPCMLSSLLTLSKCTKPVLDVNRALGSSPVSSFPYHRAEDLERRKLILFVPRRELTSSQSAALCRWTMTQPFLLRSSSLLFSLLVLTKPLFPALWMENGIKLLLNISLY